MQFNPIQLFDAVSSTFTYILAAPRRRRAVIIDPVDQHWERDLAHIAASACACPTSSRPTPMPTTSPRPAACAC
jgi:hypothetical protein